MDCHPHIKRFRMRCGQAAATETDLPQNLITCHDMLRLAAAECVVCWVRIIRELAKLPWHVAGDQGILAALN